MKDSLKTLIVTAVTTNLFVEGFAGQFYSVQDILHELSLESIDKMHTRISKRLEGLKSDSLFKKRKNKVQETLEFQKSLLSELFEHKSELETQARKAAKAKKESAEKLAVLRGIKAQKEIEAYKSMSQEDLDKAIAEAEATA